MCALGCLAGKLKAAIVDKTNQELAQAQEKAASFGMDDMVAVLKSIDSQLKRYNVGVVTGVPSPCHPATCCLLGKPTLLHAQPLYKPNVHEHPINLHVSVWRSRRTHWQSGIGDLCSDDGCGHSC